MTLLALGLLLLAALAHAAWNLLAKGSGDKTAFTWCSLVGASVLFAPLALFVGLRDGMQAGGWVFCLGTGLLHTLYFWALSRAYQSGDLSLVYPVARGVGPVLVPLLGVALLGEHLSPLAWAGVAAVVVGVYVVHLPGLRVLSLRTLSQPGIGYAFLTSFTIAVYSVWDKVGVGLVPPALYIYFPFAGAALCLSPVMLTRRRQQVALEWRERRGGVLAVALLSPLAYLLVLWALTFSPVSYIAPAREISIPVGAALGALVLGEPYGLRRLLGSLVITLGVVGLALGA